MTRPKPPPLPAFTVGMTVRKRGSGHLGTITKISDINPAWCCVEWGIESHSRSTPSVCHLAELEASEPRA